MKLKIGAKLGLGFGIVLVLMLLSAVLSYIRLNAILENVQRMTKVRVPTMEAVRIMEDRLDYAGSKTRQAILAGAEPERRAKAQQAFDNAWSIIDQQLDALGRYSAGWVLQANRDRLAALKEQLPNVRKAQQGTIDEAASGERDAIVKAGNDYADNITPVVDAATKSQDELVQSFDDLIKQDVEALDADGKATASTIWISAAFALLVGITISLFLGRQISDVTARLLHQAKAIAAGDLTGEEVKVKSEDEMGALAGSINEMHMRLRELISSITENAQNVANASEEFSAVSQQISANSQETSAQAGTVSAATEEVNRNLQTVATATEEMSATVQEIAKNASEAAKIAAEAMKAAAETNAVVSKLGDSSAEIGQVIKVITSIAQKTDLLALNATVEAARAGEAGAGFAVVANEVKELAKQTAAATEDISKRIEGIQVDTKSAVQAIKSISGIIDKVNSISSTIATAVEEQSATTAEMSRNLSEAAKGSGEVAHNINGVAQAAQNTSQGSTDSLKAAKSLAEMSTQLRELVGQFKIDNRASANGSHFRRSFGNEHGRSSAERAREQASVN